MALHNGKIIFVAKKSLFTKFRPNWHWPMSNIAHLQHVYPDLSLSKVIWIWYEKKDKTCWKITEYKPNVRKTLANVIAIRCHEGSLSSKTCWKSRSLYLIHVPPWHIIYYNINNLVNTISFFLFAIMVSSSNASSKATNPRPSLSILQVFHCSYCRICSSNFSLIVFIYHIWHKIKKE